MENSKTLSYVLAICAILFVLAMVGCSRRQIGSKALNAFSDFTYVGSGPYHGEKNSGINMTVAPHGQEPLPLPQQLEAGVQYIFHHRRPLDGEKLALSELPARLRQQGIEITRAPKSARDMMFPFVGGPIFSIQFKEGNRSGVIFSQLCPSYTKQVDAGWTGDDYVLVYTE